MKHKFIALISILTFSLTWGNVVFASETANPSALRQGNKVIHNRRAPLKVPYRGWYIVDNSLLRLLTIDHRPLTNFLRPRAISETNRPGKKQLRRAAEPDFVPRYKYAKAREGRYLSEVVLSFPRTPDLVIRLQRIISEGSESADDLKKEHRFIVLYEKGREEGIFPIGFYISEGVCSIYSFLWTEGIDDIDRAVFAWIIKYAADNHCAYITLRTNQPGVINMASMLLPELEIDDEETTRAWQEKGNKYLYAKYSPLTVKPIAREDVFAYVSISIGGRYRVSKSGVEGIPPGALSNFVRVYDGYAEYLGKYFGMLKTRNDRDGFWVISPDERPDAEVIFFRDGEYRVSHSNLRGLPKGTLCNGITFELKGGIYYKGSIVGTIKRLSKKVFLCGTIPGCAEGLIKTVPKPSAAQLPLFPENKITQETTETGKVSIVPRDAGIRKASPRAKAPAAAQESPAAIQETNIVPQGTDKRTREKIERFGIAIRSMAHGQMLKVLDIVDQLSMIRIYFFTVSGDAKNNNAAGISQLNERIIGIGGEFMQTIADLNEIQAFVREKSKNRTLTADDVHGYSRQLRKVIKDLKGQKKGMETADKGLKIPNGSRDNLLALKDLPDTLACMQRIIDVLENRLAFAEASGVPKAIPFEKFLANMPVKDQAYINVEGESYPNVLTIRNEVPAGTMLYGDGISLASAVSNIIHNAEYFARKQHIQDNDIPPEALITARLDGDFVRIDIADDGPGILPELLKHDERTDRPRLFNLNVSTRQGGTGLGTTEAWYAINDAKGTISVTSQHISKCAPGANGTTFTILLPINGAKGKNIPKAVSSPRPNGDRKRTYENV